MSGDQPVAWSLFAGIGGFDLALERAGIRVDLQCEIEAYCRAVLAERFPGARQHGDVCTLGAADVRVDDDRHRPDVDPRRAGDSAGAHHADARRVAPRLVCGGFPCQDLSTAGRRAGLAGARSALFFELARVADAVLDAGGWLVAENVPGLLSSNGGRDFAVVLATLAELGFHDLAWRVLDSRHFGVPQRRRRVYIVARRARGRHAREVLLESESRRRDPAARGEARESLAGTLGGVSSSGGWRVGADEAAAGPNSNTPGRRREDDANLIPVGFHMIQDPISEPDATPALGRKSSGMGVHAHGVRRLTPRECERLQGFPDDWTLIHGASDSKRYAALGNAVTVNVVEWIARRLRQHVERSAA